METLSLEKQIVALKKQGISDEAIVAGLLASRSKVAKQRTTTANADTFDNEPIVGNVKCIGISKHTNGLGVMVKFEGNGRFYGGFVQNAFCHYLTLGNSYVVTKHITKNGKNAGNTTHAVRIGRKKCVYNKI